MRIFKLIFVNYQIRTIKSFVFEYKEIGFSDTISCLIWAILEIFDLLKALIALKYVYCFVLNMFYANNLFQKAGFVNQDCLNMIHNKSVIVLWRPACSTPPQMLPFSLGGILPANFSLFGHVER